MSTIALRSARIASTIVLLTLTGCQPSPPDHETDADGSPSYVLMPTI